MMVASLNWLVAFGLLKKLPSYEQPFVHLTK